MLDRWGYVRTTLQQRGISTSLYRFRQHTLPTGTTRADIPCYNEVLFLLNAHALPVALLAGHQRRAAAEKGIQHGFAGLGEEADQALDVAFGERGGVR